MKNNYWTPRFTYGSKSKKSDYRRSLPPKAPWDEIDDMVKKIKKSKVTKARYTSPPSEVRIYDKDGNLKETVNCSTGQHFKNSN